LRLTLHKSHCTHYGAGRRCSPRAPAVAAHTAQVTLHSFFFFSGG
jgi:hypothetical protein